MLKNLTMKEGGKKVQQKPSLMRSVISLLANINFFEGKKKRSFWLELIILLNSGTMAIH